MKNTKRQILFRSLSVFLSLVLIAVPTITVLATTDILSANGNVWDVYDHTDADTGGIDDGSQDAFDDYGMISMYVADGSGSYVEEYEDVDGFGLILDGSGRRFVTTTPVTVGGIETSRDLNAPATTDYMRYIDTFTNTTSETRRVWVVWGGDLGSDSTTTVAATSSGDLNITTADTWAVTIESPGYVAAGPATDPPVGYALGTEGNPVFDDVVEYYDGHPYGSWPGNGNDNLAYQYYFELAPGETVKLAYFLYRGLEETNPPAWGSEIALAQTVLTDILENPTDYFSDISADDQQLIMNWDFTPEPVAVDPEPVVVAEIPSTGFAPDRVTTLPEQTVSYAQSALWLEIPKLGVKVDIVGVPQADGKWDVSWLGNNAGWLNGTAYPTWNGNSVLTGHVWNADNTVGPFGYINTLWYGDQIIVHAWGGEYVYEVRSVQQVDPSSTAQLLKHEELPWLTLVTCRGYDEATGTYQYRILVKAILVDVK
jgi:LPXTG-site transpeptidase (sortase) family protein